MDRIRLIETGGTICMVPGPGGLIPAEGRVPAALEALGAKVEALALKPLVDSAEAGPVFWNRLLDLIEAAPGPVIVTHGTDTMAFTGAALDAALAGSGRRVVLCGSMHPLGHPGGDGEGNLALALGATGGQGVVLAFASRLWPGGRLVKAHSNRARAFRIAGEVAAPRPRARRFDPALRLGILTISPGMAAGALSAALNHLDGAVLRVFGAGTLPSDPALATALFEAKARGCRIVAISQCETGGLDPGAYAAGAGLWAAGVENGGRQSAEQALTRLWLSLS